MHTINDSPEGRYPELLEDGGLAGALERAFEAAARAAAVSNAGRLTSRGKFWALFKNGARSINISAAKADRDFVCNLFEHGDPIGAFASPLIDRVCHLAVLFLSASVPQEQLATLFEGVAFFDTTETSVAGEANDPMACWSELVSLLAEDSPEFAKLAAALSHETRAGEFFPFQSVGGLYLSRWRHRPYSTDLPGIVQLSANRFRVVDNKGSSIGEGDQTAVKKIFELALADSI